MDLIRPKENLRSVPPDPAKALPLLEKACNEGNLGDACAQYGGLHINGIRGSIKSDPEKAFDYSGRACARGSIPGCHNLRKMFNTGFGTEKDLKKGEEIAKVIEKLKKQNPSDGS